MKEIDDDEIMLLGGGNENPWWKRPIWWIVGGCIVLVLCAVLSIITLHSGKSLQDVVNPPASEVKIDCFLSHIVYPTEATVLEFDTTVNDIPLHMIVPCNLKPELSVGKLNKDDKDIVYITQAADIRGDNHKIVGAFVLEGKPLAWGLSKKGYCAIIDNKITVGVAENSPLFEEATERNGYFFRQYPLVDNGKLVENNPKNKSKRRALCACGNRIAVVETNTTESFHDFSQALVDVGFDNAIYLVGGDAYGWIIDKNGVKNEHGVEILKEKHLSYILWRRM